MDIEFENIIVVKTLVRTLAKHLVIALGLAIIAVSVCMRDVDAFRVFCGFVLVFVGLVVADDSYGARTKTILSLSHNCVRVEYPQIRHSTTERFRHEVYVFRDDAYCVQACDDAQALYLRGDAYVQTDSNAPMQHESNVVLFFSDELYGKVSDAVTDIVGTEIRKMDIDSFVQMVGECL